MTWKLGFIAVLAVAACGKSGNKQHQDSTKADPKVPPLAPTVKQGKGDCKTDYAPRPKRDPNPMCKIAGGTFAMTDDSYGNGKKMTVTLSPYYIDQFEVTVGQMVTYLNATHADSCDDPDLIDTKCFTLSGPEGNRSNGEFVRKLADGSYQAEPGTERFPYVGASRLGAQQYCEWAGKTLPTEPQWEFAARHDPTTGKDLVYPWGDEFDGKRARCAHDTCPDGPDNWEPVDVGTYDGTNGHADGRSPWGVFDMAGNVAEVVAGCWYEYAPCAGGPCKDPPPAGRQNPSGDPIPPPPGTGCEPIMRGGGLEGPNQLKSTARRERPFDGFRCARARP